jgi:hypothetical protein
MQRGIKVKRAELTDIKTICPFRLTDGEGIFLAVTSHSLLRWPNRKQCSRPVLTRPWQEIRRFAHSILSETRWRQPLIQLQIVWRDTTVWIMESIRGTDASEFIDQLRQAVYGSRSPREFQPWVPQLSRLSQLAQQGWLSSVEWQQAKKRLLAAESDLAGDLCSLHSLWKAGILSESEYRLKKWSLLARS